MFVLGKEKSMQIVVLLIVLFNGENEEIFFQVKITASCHFFFTPLSTHESTATCQNWAKMDMT